MHTKQSAPQSGKGRARSAHCVALRYLLERPCCRDDKRSRVRATGHSAGLSVRGPGGVEKARHRGDPGRRTIRRCQDCHGWRTTRPCENISAYDGRSTSNPAIAGLNDVEFLTYEQIFENDRLPRSMIVIGCGPIGMEMAQAHQPLGAKVSGIADPLLPKDEPAGPHVLQ